MTFDPYSEGNMNISSSNEALQEYLDEGLKGIAQSISLRTAFDTYIDKNCARSDNPIYFYDD